MEKSLKDEPEIVGDGILTVYEVSYLLLPSLAEEQIPAKSASLKEMLESARASIVSHEDPVLIDIAYAMTKVVQTVRHKVNSGYFGWIKFEMADGIETIKKNFDSDADVLRYLIIKTVRENTLLGGKMMLKKEEKVKNLPEQIEEAPVEVVLPVADTVPEDIDKTIDDLVIA